eukprot:CAMPEP_0113852562 /NCGR_PEP_ID=MMETSP0372-20130328/5614_1 /TAXON_ID=340204 /ORGANISM="Lankesteria abbotti" /LENGTH=194 /DNA_ID=CAMNT_0000824195 /DNA_START=1 /DNA_END=585 /DNA_ORIENTATION=- /assembly_acc=CAM_ASM_000359
MRNVLVVAALWLLISEAITISHSPDVAHPNGDNSIALLPNGGSSSRRGMTNPVAPPNGGDSVDAFIDAWIDDLCVSHQPESHSTGGSSRSSSPRRMTNPEANSGIENSGPTFPLSQSNLPSRSRSPTKRSGRGRDSSEPDPDKDPAGYLLSVLQSTPPTPPKRRRSRSPINRKRYDDDPDTSIFGFDPSCFPKN